MTMVKTKVILAILFLLFSLPLRGFCLEEEEKEGTWSGSITGGGAVINMDEKNTGKDKSYKYGEYTGITDNGYGIGDFDVLYENDDNFYLNFLGEDLGLKSRSLSMETGWYGGYELFLNYDETPHYVSNNAKTIYNGVNGNNLTLPEGFERGDFIQNFAWKATEFENSLNAYKKGVNIRTDRKSGAVGFSVPVWSVFDFDVNYRREEKRGLKSIAGVMGQSGGDRRSIWLPEPVNYSVDEITASLAYLGEKVQMNLNYFYSNFRNKYNSLTFENPFYSEMVGVRRQNGTTYYINAKDAGNIRTGETIVTQGPYYYGRYGQMSLDPDNEYHRVSLSTGLDLPMSSRITVLGEYGLMTQDNALLPYTINSDAAVHTGLPRNSAMAVMDTFHATANLSSRPLEDLSTSFHKFTNVLCD
jgi:hypothetical protein